jgi:uncharacterized protein
MTKTTERYFYDTYAIIEFVKGNPGYKPYFAEAAGYMTKQNLMELYFNLRKHEGLATKEASEWIDYFAGYMMDYDLVDIAGSMDVRLQLQRKGVDVSYTDALGYYLAGKMQVPFLTGDREFKELKNVEFVR